MRREARYGARSRTRRGSATTISGRRSRRTGRWEARSPSSEWEGKSYEGNGEILVFEPERELAYSHRSAMGGKPDEPDNYHVVRVTLDERDGTTHVTLQQSNLQGGATDEDRANRQHYEKNWMQMLEGLKETTEP